jgi:hypothetical protein
MYPRQFKQFLKTAHPEFDERRYGSINDLMRACQKDGLLRLERDRQGGLRVFASGAGSARASVPHGWGVGHRDTGGNGHANGSNGQDSERSTDGAVESGAEDETQDQSVSAPVIHDELRRIELDEVAEPIVEADVTPVAVTEAPKRKTRARKTAAKTSRSSKSSTSTRSSKAKVRE